MRSSHPWSPIDHPSNGSKSQNLVNSGASFYIIVFLVLQIYSSVPKLMDVKETDEYMSGMFVN
jgi:hypothetical protein